MRATIPHKDTDKNMYKFLCEWYQHFYAVEDILTVRHIDKNNNQHLEGMVSLLITMRSVKNGLIFSELEMINYFGESRQQEQVTLGI